MSKTVLRLTLLLTFGPLFVFGQNQLPGRWLVGARAGITLAGVNQSAISSFNGIPLTNITSKSVSTGLIGLIVNYRLDKHWSLQTEIGDNQYGGLVDGTATLSGFPSIPFSSTIKISALELPLLVKYSFGNGRIGGFVNGGGLLAYTFKNNITVNNTALSALVPTDVNHKYIYGIIGGAGATYRLGPGQLLLEGRYSYSLGDNLNIPFDGGKLHYQVGTISVGYLYEL